METKLNDETRSVLYNIKYHQIKMMKQQKFDTQSEEDLDFFANFEEEGMMDKFAEYYIDKAFNDKTTITEALSNIYTNSTGTSKQCYYMARSDSATGDVLVDQVRKMFTEIGKTVRNIVIIAPNKLGSDAASQLADFPAYKFSTFTHKELGYDPFDSDWVPEHTLLSTVEAKMILNELNTKIDNLPAISETDPPIKRLDGRSGQIVKITRKITNTSSLVKESIAYRRIIFEKKVKRK